MKFLLSFAFGCVSSYFLSKHGISIIKTPVDFIMIVVFLILSGSVWQYED